jgi:hypothetical protein
MAAMAGAMGVGLGMSQQMPGSASAGVLPHMSSAMDASGVGVVGHSNSAVYGGGAGAAMLANAAVAAGAGRRGSGPKDAHSLRLKK